MTKSQVGAGPGITDVVGCRSFTPPLVSRRDWLQSNVFEWGTGQGMSAVPGRVTIWEEGDLMSGTAYDTGSIPVVNTAAIAAADAWWPHLVRRLGVEAATDTLQRIRAGLLDQATPGWSGGDSTASILARVETVRALLTLGVRDPAAFDHTSEWIELAPQHTPPNAWTATVVHALDPAAEGAEVRRMKASPAAYRQLREQAVAIAETVRAALTLRDTSAAGTAEAILSCVSTRLGVGDVLPWLGEPDAARQAAAALHVPVPRVAHAVALGLEWYAIAAAVCGGER